MSDASSLRRAVSLPVATGNSNSTVRYIDGELALANGTNWIYPQRVETTFIGGTTDSAFYVANRAMEVVAIRQVHSTAGSDAGAVTLKITKDTGVTTPGGDSAGAATTTTAGVAGVNEVQSIAAHTAATGGTYTLTLTLSGESAFTTGAIAYNANAATIQTAIDVAATTAAITGWTNADIVVTGGPLSSGALTLTFSGNSVKEKNHTQTTIDGAALTAAGTAGAPSTTTPGDVGVDEVQSIAAHVAATGGTYTLSLNINGGGVVTTGAIAYNANAATVQTAINAVSGVTADHIVVTGGPLSSGALTLTFSGDDVDETDQAQTTIDGALLTIAGTAGAPSTSTQGVVGVNEVQSIAPYLNTVTGGTYTLSLTINGGGVVTTGALAYNASAATVQTAVNAVSGVTAGHVAITGGPLTTTALTVTFSGADVDKTNQTQTTIDGSSLVSTGLTVQTGTFNLKSTANTVQTATLTATAANKKLAAGDKLSANFSGTMTAVAGVVATVTLRPI